MKKRKLLFILLVLSLSVFSAMNFSSYADSTATATETTEVTTVPTTVTSNDDVFTLFFGNFAGIILLTMIVSGWITSRLLPTLNSTLKQLLSWIICFGVTFFGNAKGYGMFGEGGMFDNASTWMVVAIAMGCAGVANKLWDDKTLDKMLRLVFAKK